MRRCSGKAKPSSLRKPARMAAAESRSSAVLDSVWIRARFGPGLSRAWVLAALVLNGIQPALPLLARSKIRSKFKTPKTPPSHGLTGFVAIETGAKKRCFRARTAAKNGSRPRTEQVLKTRLCGRCAAVRARPIRFIAQTRAKAVCRKLIKRRAGCGLAPVWIRLGFGLDSAWIRLGFGQGLGKVWVRAALVLSGTPPALPLLTCSEIRSKFKAPKTPPSHGFSGLAAIKAGAKKRKWRVWRRLAAARASCVRPPSASGRALRK